jgi:predicted chitinase
MEEKMAEISVFKVSPRKNDLSVNPSVHIYLSSYSSDSKTGRILLSAQLMTAVEIDESVNYLIKQLERARAKAMKELQKAKELLRESMQQRLVELIVNIKSSRISQAGWQSWPGHH